MRNWDESEEKGNDNCSVEADLAQAQSVCRHIGIPLHEVDFVRQYWTQVFSDFLAQVQCHGTMRNKQHHVEMDYKQRTLRTSSYGLHCEMFGKARTSVQS